MTTSVWGVRDLFVGFVKSVVLPSLVWINIDNFTIV